MAGLGGLVLVVSRATSDISEDNRKKLCWYCFSQNDRIPEYLFTVTREIVTKTAMQNVINELLCMLVRRKEY